MDDIRLLLILVDFFPDFLFAIFYLKYAVKVFLVISNYMDCDPLMQPSNEGGKFKITIIKV